MQVSKSKEQIANVVRSVFQARRAIAQEQLAAELRHTQADFNKRGVLRSGFYAKKVGDLVGQALQRAIDETIEELERARRDSKRKDSASLWDTAQDVLFEICNVEVTKSNNHAVDVVNKTSRDGVFSSVAAQHFSQVGDNLRWRIQTNISALKAKAQFIDLKTPEDRIATNVPDVVVMMWFPTAEHDGEAAYQRAQAKFAKIEEAVSEATDGRARVRKFDDPSILPQDRISAAVERWLEKAVLVICDLEGNRPNVFYEFGYARASGTDVLGTRPKGTETALHLGHWQMAEYENLEELKSKLVPKLRTQLAQYDLIGDVTP